MILSFSKSKELLDFYNIPQVNQELAFSFDEILNFERKNTYPLILKIASKSLLHKTEEKAVISNIQNRKELRGAWLELEKISKKPEIKKGFEGILVQKMITGVELIVGAKKDKVFGPVVMFGLGGIFTEVYKDTVFRLAPINGKEAKKMIKEIKGYKILEGVRGKKSVDIESLAEVLVGASKLILEKPEIKEIDLNPVIANEKGAKIVDVKIIF